MDAGINNVIYMELYSGPKMANATCGKMIVTGTIDRDSTVFIQQISVLNILNMLHNLCFFPSKCRLFHNATSFGSRIIHILNTGCAKI